jgi:hypothetical protein
VTNDDEEFWKVIKEEFEEDKPSRLMLLLVDACHLAFIVILLILISWTFSCIISHFI